ncbi:hypothetical protein BH11PSE4_BH11PSE4_35320 [soil metagenome]
MRLRIGAMIAAMLLMAIGVARAVDGTDLPGHDYTHFSAPSALSCQNSCGGDKRCKAYTWVKPGIQNRTGRCYLKNWEPPIVMNDCCDSLSRDFIEPSDMRAEDKTDRPGADINSFAVNNWSECQALCARGSNCAAWSYVRSSKRCFAKKAVPNPVTNAGVVSGVKWKAPLQPID